MKKDGTSISDLFERREPAGREWNTTGTTLVPERARWNEDRAVPRGCRGDVGERRNLPMEEDRRIDTISWRGALLGSTETWFYWRVLFSV